MDAVTLDAKTRSVLGKKVKQLRGNGVTPIHVYGKVLASLSLQADTSELQRVLLLAGRTAPVSVKIDGADHFAFVREVQRHPVSGAILHVDFLQVSLTERMVSEIPIQLVGEAPATREAGSTLVQTLHSLQVESLPTDVPSHIDVDVSSLVDFEAAVHVSSLDLGSKVTLLSDPEMVIARVQPPKAEVAVDEAEEAVAVPVGGKPSGAGADPA
jgi:large subunit ribosomal protein L25